MAACFERNVVSWALTVMKAKANTIDIKIFLQCGLYTISFTLNVLITLDLDIFNLIYLS